MITDGSQTFIPGGSVDNLPLENEDYALSCKIAEEGNPTTVTSYEWYHNGTRIVEQTSATLSLTDLQRYESGGRYQCAAINTAGLGNPGKELDMRVGCKYYICTCTQ